MLQTRMVVIQPTPFCNIDCDYCYLRSRGDRSRMSHNTLHAIADRIIALIDPAVETLVVWHGGEPTTVPLAWYEASYPILQRAKRGEPLSFALQSNGIGITDRWAAFLANTGTHVGISLDGPEDLHNRHRRTRSGGPTSHFAMRAIDVLRRHGIEPGVITVLTADSLSRAPELLAFFAAHQLHNISFSIEEVEGANTTTSLTMPAVEERVHAFLLQFMREAIRANVPIHLREAERILGLLAANGSAVRANEQTEPFAIVTVDWAGGIYTYSPEFTEHARDDWAFLRLGNIHHNTMSEVMEGERFRRLEREVAAGLGDCLRAALIGISAGAAPQSTGSPNMDHFRSARPSSVA